MTDPPAYPAAPALMIVGFVLAAVSVPPLVSGRRAFSMGVFTAACVCWLAALVLSVPQ